ncbi:MAG TPA: hypothetical protein VMB02_04265 [Candidatus Aquilonibacter sp.]|nr:hypothetical protein [Candidatus Aquilonibacter sp.]
MIPRRLAPAAALLLACAGTATMGASTGLPDWSGQWENVGATPDASGGFNQSLDQVLKGMEWNPPTKPEVQARVDKVDAMERKRMDAIDRLGQDPGGAVRACTFGYPLLMLESPLMFEVLTTPKETALIFSSREIRHVYTDGRPHTPADELWATPWGDSIGHWEGQTLVIDTIAVKSPFVSESEGIPILAFGSVEDELTVAILSSQARFVERIRMLDKDHLEDRITIIDPTNLTAPWHMIRTYERVTHVNRMVYEDCEGEDRNPIVNGHFTLAPPPPDTPPSPPSLPSPPTPQSPTPR